MRAVTRAMLDDMPDPCDLHLERAEGRCLVMVGSAVLSEYAGSDVVMRNFAVTTMRLAGFSGKRVAEVFGLPAPYVPALHAAALRDGSRALVKQPGPGRPAELARGGPGRARQRRGTACDIAPPRAGPAPCAGGGGSGAGTAVAGGRGQRPGDRAAAGDGRDHGGPQGRGAGGGTRRPRRSARPGRGGRGAG